MAWKKKRDLHSLAHVNMEYPDDRYPKLQIYVSELILDRYEYIPVACYSALYDMTLTKTTYHSLCGEREFLNYTF
jgi:hypothetical protein